MGRVIYNKLVEGTVADVYRKLVDGCEVCSFRIQSETEDVEFKVIVRRGKMPTSEQLERTLGMCGRAMGEFGTVTIDVVMNPEWKREG